MRPELGRAEARPYNSSVFFWFCGVGNRIGVQLVDGNSLLRHYKRTASV
jgi:hypothetical protein